MPQPRVYIIRYVPYVYNSGNILHVCLPIVFYATVPYPTLPYGILSYRNNSKWRKETPTQHVRSYNKCCGGGGGGGSAYVKYDCVISHRVEQTGRTDDSDSIPIEYNNR